MTTAIDSTVLEQAFRRFEKAAVTLEQRHGSLHEDVARLERELLDSNRRLETVLDALDGGIAVVARDGRLVRTNRAFDRMRLIDSRGRWLPNELRGLIEDTSRAGSAARFRVRGREGWRDLSAALVSVDDVEASRVLAIQDVTAIRREEEEGGRRQRLEALGRMAAELAHELRNPLGSIRLFASMLQEDLEDRAEQRDMVEHILSASSGLEATISNLLSFAAPSRMVRLPVELRAIVAEACALLKPTCSARSVSLHGPGGGDPCTVSGDREALRRLVWNILANALSATREGGTVRALLRSERGRVILEIDDDGCGIAPEDLSRVFDPFFSRTGGGTGLGLSISQRTVEQHGGRISLDSEPGRGTQVRIELPNQLTREEHHG